MVLTYIQETNPIRSTLWLPFQDIDTVDGLVVTTNYSGQGSLETVQLGDGITSTTFPFFVPGSKGFEFNFANYIDLVTPLSLGPALSICLFVRPYFTSTLDQYLCAFSNGGGIILNDSSSSNELTYYDGTTTISSGIELDNNRFYTIVVSKDSSNSVSIYVNGVLESSGFGTETNLSLSYIGCDNSITNNYCGDIREFCCFDDELVDIQISALHNRLMRVVGGQSRNFSPLMLLEGADGLQMDLDAISAVTKNTQPTITSWSGTNWSGTIPGPFTHTIGAGVGLYAYNGASMNVLTINNRYFFDWTLANATGINDTHPYYGTSGTGTVTVNGDYTAEGTCTVIQAVGWLPDVNSPCTVTFRGATPYRCGSVTSITCQGNLGNLTQATAVNMPWLSDSNAPISILVNGHNALYFDGTADYLVNNLAASAWPLHKAAGFTCCFCIKPDSSAASLDVIIDTCNITSTNHGVTVYYDAANTRIGLFVENGSGSDVIALTTSVGSVPKNAWSRIAITWDQTNGASIRVDEDSPVTQASILVASSNNASFTLTAGATATASYFAHGALAGLQVIIGSKTDVEMVAWLAWAKEYYAL